MAWRTGREFYANFQVKHAIVLFSGAYRKLTDAISQYEVCRASPLRERNGYARYRYFTGPNQGQ